MVRLEPNPAMKGLDWKDARTNMAVTVRLLSNVNSMDPSIVKYHLKEVGKDIKNRIPNKILTILNHC